MFVQNVSIETNRIGEALRTSALTNAHHAVLLRMQNSTLGFPREKTNERSKVMIISDWICLTYSFIILIYYENMKQTPNRICRIYVLSYLLRFVRNYFDRLLIREISCDKTRKNCHRRFFNVKVMHDSWLGLFPTHVFMCIRMTRLF